jgi:hypothetical protein
MRPSALSALIEAWNELAFTKGTAISYEHLVPGGRFLHCLELQETQSSVGSDVSKIVERLACQVLVSFLPDEALAELRGNLLELYAYYASLSNPAAILAAPPAPVSYSAQFGTTVMRPDIELEE